MPYNNINFGQAMPGQGMDYGQQDQASLFQQIQQYQEFLAAQKEKEKQLGNNQSILAGQYAGQDAAIAQQQRMLNDPSAPVQNWYRGGPDADNLRAQATYLGQQPVAKSESAKGTSVWDAVGNQSRQIDRDRQVQGLLNQANNVTTTMSPQEFQAAQEKQQMGRINDANSMVNSIPLEQGVSPSVLGQFGDLAQKAGAEGGKSRTAGILGQSEIDKQQVANIGQIGAAQATAQGNVEAAQAQYDGVKSKVTKATMATLEQGVTAVGNVMNQLSQLGKDYDPEFGSGKHQAIASFAGMAERWGLGTYDKDFRERFARFQLKAEQSFNAYRKVITGASATESEIERLRKGYFNLDAGGPVEQKAKLSELLVQQGVGLYAAAKALKAARDGIDLGIGEIAKPGTEEFGRQVEALSGQLDPTEIEHVKKSVMAQYPGLLQDPKAEAEANGIKPFDSNAYRSESRAAKIQQRLQQGGQ